MEQVRKNKTKSKGFSTYILKDKSHHGRLNKNKTCIDHR